MPYRRLPKTDQARLTALKIAIKKGEKDGIINPIIPLKLQHDAKTLLTQYEQALSSYKQSLNNQKNTGSKSRANIKLTRLYISHFIQVLNMSIARGEFKKGNKAYYELDAEKNSVPNLTSEKSLLKWGERIIKGEEERIKSGGAPIYNPNIAKVKVYFDVFKESQNEQKIFHLNTARYADAVKKMREKCDDLILSIWNDVESHFADLSWDDKLRICKEYGLIYYYRRGEERPDKA